MTADANTQLLSMEDFRRQVAEVGLKAEEIPNGLPAGAAGQWLLLAPYVGKPLSAIPKGLVLLFLLQEEGKANPLQMAAAIRKLPPAERMVQPTGDKEDAFL